MSSRNLVASLPFFRAQAGMAALLVVMAGIFACGPEEEKKRPGFDIPGNGDNNDDGPEAIIGNWADPDGNIVSISEERWDSLQLLAKVVKINASEGYLIVETSDSSFSKQMWTQFEDDEFYLCQLSGNSSIAAAENRRGADPEDLEAGCGESPWVLMSASDPDIEISGKWRDEFNSTFTFTYRSWERRQNISQELATVELFDNDERWLIRKSSNGALTRMVWTEVDRAELFGEERDSFFQCSEPVTAESPEDAAEQPSSADPGDLEKGCGGYAWTELVRVH